MLRRSLRLQEAGYYTEEGTPFISYREILYKVFWRRKHFRRDDHHHDFIDDDCHWGDDQDVTYTQESTRITSNNNYVSNTGAETLSRGTQASHTTGTQTSRDIRNKVKTRCTFFVRIFVCFLLLLLLGFGITHMHTQIRDNQQELQSLRQWMDMFAPQLDTIPNYALKSQGARVLPNLSSDTYSPHVGILNSICSWSCTFKRQQGVIQGHSSLHPGECWPFSGDRGHLFISLSHPVSITHVTLGHITKSQSPTGYITSAPREFSIYGMTTMDEAGTYLGTLVYDQDGAAFRTFELPEINANNGVFRYVKLQIENNWGNTDYTCLYGFRVHGKLPS